MMIKDRINIISNKQVTDNPIRILIKIEIITINEIIMIKDKLIKNHNTIKTNRTIKVDSIKMDNKDIKLMFIVVKQEVVTTVMIKTNNTNQKANTPLTDPSTKNKSNVLNTKGETNLKPIIRKTNPTNPIIKINTPNPMVMTDKKDQLI